MKAVKPYGVLDLIDPASDDPLRSWVMNGQRLKHYFRGEVECLTSIVHLVDP